MKVLNRDSPMDKPASVWSLLTELIPPLITSVNYAVVLIVTVKSPAIIGDQLIPIFKNK